MDYNILNIKLEEEDIDVETVEIQPDMQVEVQLSLHRHLAFIEHGHEWWYFYRLFIWIQFNMYSRQSIICRKCKINTVDMKKNVHIVADDFGMNVKGGG